MNPCQLCPKCGKENRVAGLSGSAGTLHGPAVVVLYCGFCGKRFPVSTAEKAAEQLPALLNVQRG